MSARVEIPAAADTAASIDGQRRGERVVRCARDGMALGPDHVLHELLDVLDCDGVHIVPSARLRGYMRALAKALEQGGRTR